MNEQLSLYFWIGKRIQLRRRDKNMSQAELADAVVCARTSLVHWEEGKNRIQIEDLYRIAKILNCSVVDLLPPNNDRVLQTREQAFLDFLAATNNEGEAQ